MRDESRAAIVSVIWLVVFAIFALDPTPFKTLLWIAVTIIEAMYIRHDAERERAEKRQRRYVEYADEALRKELEH